MSLGLIEQISMFLFFYEGHIETVLEMFTIILFGIFSNSLYLFFIILPMSPSLTFKLKKQFIK